MTTVVLANSTQVAAVDADVTNLRRVGVGLVDDYGAVGDGATSDVAAFGAALSGARVVKLTPGKTYYLPSAVTIAQNCKIIADDAILIGDGFNSGADLFEVTAAVNVEVQGGSFRNTRRAFAFSSVRTAKFKDAEFENMGHAIGVTDFDAAGSMWVVDCDFDDMEVGVMLQTSSFPFFKTEGCNFTSLGEKAITTRPRPFDKKIVSGVWYQSLTGDCSATLSGNYVDGVTGFATAPTEPEVHGLAVSLSNASDTNVTLSRNTVKNVNSAGIVEGGEGLMGRGRRVIISKNILKDAGIREGMIYAKGSLYHKIDGNIIEATGTPDAETRGIISTGSDCDITNNKFVNVPVGIYSRALKSLYRGNEFISCGTACIILALESGDIHVRTICERNESDENCGTFFSDSTAGTEVHGDFTFDTNYLYGAGRSVILKGAANFVFNGNTVDRKTPNANRDLFVFSASVGHAEITDNMFFDFDSSAGDGRVFTASANVLSINFSGNRFGKGAYALWLRDPAYTHLTVDDNNFRGPFSAAAINGNSGNTQATTMFSFTGNMGVSPKQFIDNLADLPASPNPGYRAWITDSSVTTLGAVAAATAVTEDQADVPVVYDGSNYLVGV